MVALFLTVLLPACTKPGTFTPLAPDDPELVTLADALVAEHNQRVAAFDRLYSLGVFELRWVDTEGTKHSEPQINAKLWVRMPHEIALRGEKLGEDLLWAGSNAERYWLFDMTGDETQLFTDLHGKLRATTTPISQEVTFPSYGLLDVVALAPVEDARPVIQTDAGTVVVEGRGAAGPVRMTFDRRSRLPRRIEILRDAEDADVLVYSELSRYKSVPLPGKGPGYWPKMPTLIDITDEEATFALKLALDSPTGDADDQRWDVVFDLPKLMEYYRPAEVHGESP